MDQEKQHITILVVDDEENICKSIERLISSRTEFAAKIATSGEAGLEILAAETIDVVISDERMPGMKGADFISRVREEYPDTARIMITGYADTQAILKAVNTGELYRFLRKPWDNEELLEVIQSAAEHLRIKRENVKLQKELAERNKELEHMNQHLGELVQERTEKLRESYQKLKIAHELVSSQSKSTVELLLSILHHSKPFLATRASRAAALVTLFKDHDEITPEKYFALRNTALLHTCGGLHSNFTKDSEWREIAKHTAQMLMGFHKLDAYGRLLSSISEEGVDPQTFKIEQQVLFLVLTFDARVREAADKADDLIYEDAVKVVTAQLTDDDFPGLSQKSVSWFNAQLRTRLNLKNKATKVQSVDDLIPGQRLVTAINLTSGSLVLPEGTVLTQDHIDHLSTVKRFLRDDIVVLPS